MCILKRLAYLEEQLGKHELAEEHYREVLDGFRRLGTRHMTRVTGESFFVFLSWASPKCLDVLTPLGRSFRGFAGASHGAAKVA